MTEVILNETDQPITAEDTTTTQQESLVPYPVINTVDNSESVLELGDFGVAILHLKHGGKVARKGWNGKGMFIYYVPAASYPAMTEVAKKEFGEMVNYNPYLAIKNVNGTVSTWVPSINDVLAEDWIII